MMRCGAVVVTYNNADTIDACLESLIANNIHSIAVVDNSSTDGTAKLVRRYHVLIRNNDQNVGFARAANQGARMLATGQNKHEFIFFINPDAALMGAGTIAGAVGYLSQNTDAAIAGLLLKDKNLAPEIGSWGGEVTLLSIFERKFHRPSAPASPTQVAWVSGGALLIRRDIFELLGGFDPEYFMYWEDVDLCKRARAAGYKVVSLPEYQAVHKRGASWQDSRDKTGYYDRSADRYFRKHYAAPIWLTHRLLRRIYRFSGQQVR